MERECRRNWRVLVVVACGPILVVTSLWAADNVWTNTTGGKWETASNWTLGAPNSTQAVLYVTNATSKTVRIDSTTASLFAATMSNNNLTVAGVGGAVNSLAISNAGLSRTFRILDELVIGSGGSVTITNSILRVEGQAGGGCVIDGSLTLLNAGQLYLTNILTFVGSATNGSLTIRGGTAQASDLFVGDLSQGTLTMSGGALTLFGDLLSALFVGYANDATGAVWITGGQVLMTNDDTYVGYSGVGQMAISNGTVQTSYLSTGEFGQGTLTVAGGTLNLLAPLSSGLYVGHFADSTGTVWVTGGQVFVTNDFTTIGSDGAGTMVVSNGTVRTSDMLVGEYAAGTLTVAGGTVSFSSVFTTNFTLGFFQSSSGTVWVTGGQLLASNVSTVIGISGAATLTVSNGTMRARDVVVGSDDGSQGNWVVAGGTNILSSFLTLGEFPGATGNVWVGGGLFVVTNAPPMIVGSNGVGFVTVTNGVVRARTMLLGNQTGSSGTLSVMGGATTVLSNLVAGNCGLGVPGIVNVSGGGLFVTNAPKTAFLDVRSGTLTQSGGALIVDRLVMTNVCGRFIRTGGTLTIGSTNMSANLSAVGDGIPNSWKLQYGFDLFDPTVADADPDGDGMSNLEEFLAGTVPTNSASALRITSITSEGDNVRITWTMGAGRTNALQRTPGAASGDYATNFADIFVVTNSIGSVTNYLDVGAATNDPAFYYRVRVVP